MSNLEHIKSSVDFALKELTEKDLGKYYSKLIALMRIRSTWKKYFEDFIDFLKNKIEKQDPYFFIYFKYKKFLDDNLGGELQDGIYNLLEKKGYTETKLQNINKEYNEGTLLNRIPKKTYALEMCIDYLYQPRLSLKFFWNELEYVFEDEKTLLSNYRTLPDDKQEPVAKYMQDLAAAVHIRKLK